MKRTITIIIMAIIILGLGGYIAYDKLYTKELKPEETKEEKKEEIKEVEENVDVQDGYVYNEKKVKDGDGCSNYKEFELNYEVAIPKINSSKTNAIKLNEVIMKKYKDKLNIFLNGTMGGYNVSYKYIVKDNVIYINVNESSAGRCSSGLGHTTTYYYDIKNDKILNSEEAFKAAGFIYDDLINSYELKDEDPVGYDYIKNANFSECDRSNTDGCGCGLAIENDTLKPYFNTQCV